MDWQTMLVIDISKETKIRCPKWIIDRYEKNPFRIVFKYEPKEKGAFPTHKGMNMIANILDGMATRLHKRPRQIWRERELNHYTITLVWGSNDKM